LKIEKIICNEDDAIDFLRQLFALPSDTQSFAVSFEGWPTLQIKIVGGDYKSSLKSSQLRALLKLQETIYYQYEVLSGRQESTLTSEERKFLELNVEVGNGSSNLVIELIKIFTDILSNGLPNTSLVAGVVLLAAIYGSTKTINRYFDVKEKEIDNDRIKLELMSGSSRNNDLLVKLIESAFKSLETLARCAPDSDDIYINQTSTKPFRDQKLLPKQKQDKSSSTSSSFAPGKSYNLICSVVGIKDENKGKYECRFKDSITGEILIWKEKRSNIANALDHKLRMAFNSKKFDVHIKFQIIKQMRSGGEISVFNIFGEKPRSFKSG